MLRTTLSFPSRRYGIPQSRPILTCCCWPRSTAAMSVSSPPDLQMRIAFGLRTGWSSFANCSIAGNEPVGEVQDLGGPRSDLLIRLFEFLQNAAGVIAGNQRNVFIGAEFSQQRHELRWIRQSVARDERIHLVHKLGRVQRLHFARDLDIED